MTIILNRPGFLRLPEVPGVSVTWLGPSVMVAKRQIGFIVVPPCSVWAKSQLKKNFVSG